MKRLILFLFLVGASAALGQTTLTVDGTGVIKGPVSGATFFSANSMAIGTDVQAYSSNLSALDGVTGTNVIPIQLSPGSWGTVAIGTDIQAHGAALDVINANTGSLDLSGITLSLGAFASGTAAVLPITDSGNYYTTDDVEDALAQLGPLASKKGYLQLLRPQKVDGTGAVYQNSDSTQNYFGQGKFSNSAAATGNYIEYRLIVPEDLNTGTAMRAKFEFRLSASDTGKHRYTISMADVADSGSSAGTLTNAINMDFAGDASGASGDIETVGWTTLTGWAAALTPGHHFVIRIARAGDDATNDTSTVDSYSGPLEIEYGK